MLITASSSLYYRLFTSKPFHYESNQTNHYSLYHEMHVRFTLDGHTTFMALFHFEPKDLTFRLYKIIHHSRVCHFCTFSSDRCQHLNEQNHFNRLENELIKRERLRMTLLFYQQTHHTYYCSSCGMYSKKSPLDIHDENGDCMFCSGQKKLSDTFHFL